MTTWWDRATDSERLAQIDAGIELGLTGKQISMNLRVEVNDHGSSKVTYFAYYHGRRIPRYNNRPHRSAAGYVGGVVNARNKGIPEINIRGSHEIFGTRTIEPYEMAMLDAEESV